MASWAYGLSGRYRWSQRWSDDPPIGTIVFGHEYVIYLGNGAWQPRDDTRVTFEE